MVTSTSGLGSFALTVQSSLSHDGSTRIHDSGQLFVHDSPVANDFDTDSLTITNTGSMWIGGAKVQVDGPVSLQSNGRIVGYQNATLELNGNGNLVNDGTIFAEISGSFVIQRTNNTAMIDMDGTTGNGFLVTDSSATLIVDLPLSDPSFNGTMIIRQDSEIEIRAPWTLAATGGAQLQFDGNYGGSPGTAMLSGQTVTVAGQVDIVSGTAVLSAPVHVENTATLTVNEGTTIQFDAPATIVDADSIVNHFNTTWVVNDAVYVGLGAGHFNWDGLGQNGDVQATTIVNPGGFLGIQVVSLDEPGLDERVDTDIFLNAGNLAVHTLDEHWALAGTLTMRSVGGDSPALDKFGGQDDEVLITGNVVIPLDGGSGGIRMNSVFGSTSHVSVASGGHLIIGGFAAAVDSVINGGSWTGAGQVSLDADITTVSSATTVDMPNGTFDIDGEWPGHAVVLNAPLTLNIASVERIPGSVVDDTLRIHGNGRLDVRFTDPNNTYIIDDELELNGLGGGLSSLHLAGADVELRGTTTVSGNSRSDARVDLTGYLDLAAGSTFSLNGGSLMDPNVIYAGTTFGGSGDLIVSQNRALLAEDGVLIGVDVLNRGRFEPGLSTGTVDVMGNFTETSTATFGFEFAGAPGVDQDLLNVSGNATADGTLEVKLLGNYVPAENSIYTVIDAGARLGVFDALTTLSDSIVDFNAVIVYSVDQVRVRITNVSIFGDFDDDLMLGCSDIDALVAEIASGGMGMQFDLNGDNQVNLTDLDEWLHEAGEFNIGGAYLYGDANLDGVVDGSDFVIWNSHKFTLNNGWCGADFNADGVTDGSDFVIWNANKFMSSDARQSLVPEPTGLFLLLVGLAMIRRPGR